MTTIPIAFSYVRFSTPDQIKGDSLRRQTEGARNWCEKHGVRLDEATTFRDLGKSVYTGSHRTNPDRHALAAFLKMVEGGKVPRGSYLIIENLDRLTREEVVPATHLLTGILMAAIRVVQLSPSELLLTEKSDPFDVMRAVMELSRGNNESKMKSERLGKAWDAKRASIGGRKLTGKCPFWLTLSEDGAKFIKKPSSVALVKRMFSLARSGYGSAAVAKLFNKEQILSPYGRPWNNVSVLAVLRARSVLGEFTPYKGQPGKRSPIAPPIPDYYPRIITDNDFLVVQSEIALRKQQRGPNGKGVRNLFTGLLRDAKDGTPFHVTSKRKDDWRMVSSGATRGKDGAQYVSFPFAVFERAILTKLAEVDPREIMGTTDQPDESLTLSSERAQVDAKISEFEAELLKGDVAALAKVLRQLEEQRRSLDARLAEARSKAANPLSETWGETQTLLSALEAAPDQTEARLRLRAVLRRIISEIRVLIVPRGLRRLAAVQIWFAGGYRHRDYIIYHIPAKNQNNRVASWSVRTLLIGTIPDGLDLRNREHALQLEAALSEIDPAAFC